MREEMIIENKQEREKLVKRVEVLEKIKKLLLIPGTDFATVKQVAEFYEVDSEAIQKVYQRNRDEFLDDGVCTKKAIDFLNWTKCPSQRGSTAMLFSNGEIVVIPNNGTKTFPRRAILRIGMLLRDSIVATEVRSQLLNIEEKTSNEIKVHDINEEEDLLMDIARAYASGEIDRVIAATTAYSAFQSRYIKELEPKAKIVDEMIANNSAVTTAITQKIKNTQKTKKWSKEIDVGLGDSAISVLVYIHDYINENGISPTIRDICTGTGLRSTSSVHRHIEKLDSLGYLLKDFASPRSIRVNEDKYVKLIR